MSPFALEGLRERGVTVTDRRRFPRLCTLDDLKTADRVVALHDGEHRLLMQGRFPEWAQRIDFLNVEDVEFLKPSLAMARLDKELEDFLRTVAVKTSL
jgi:protein-tyrosine phosphatase